MIFQIQFQTLGVAFLYNMYLVRHCMCKFGLNDILSLLYTKNEKRWYIMLIDLYYKCEYHTKYTL